VGSRPVVSAAASQRHLLSAAAGSVFHNQPEPCGLARVRGGGEFGLMAARVKQVDGSNPQVTDCQDYTRMIAAVVRMVANFLLLNYMEL
jgi:hypothetical protein